MKNNAFLFALNGIARAVLESLCANIVLPLFYLSVLIFGRWKNLE